MFQALKFVLVKKPVSTKKIFKIFSPSILNVFERALASTSKNYGVSKRSVDDEIKFSKLKDIELLKGLEKHTFTTNSCQDIICRFILSENIMVPNLMGYTKITDRFQRFRLIANN